VGGGPCTIGITVGGSFNDNRPVLPKGSEKKAEPGPEKKGHKNARRGHDLTDTEWNA